MRHDFALLIGGVTKHQAEAISADLQIHGWRSQVKANPGEESDESKFILLIALENESKVVAEAERQKTSRVNVSRKAQAKVAKYVEEQEKKGIRARVSRAECQVPITQGMMASLEDDEDLYTVMSEADRVRLCYNILTKIKLAEMGQTSAIFSTKQYRLCDVNEKFLDFLKRHKLYDDIQPLHSRSRMIKKMQEFKLAKKDGLVYDANATLLSKSLKQRFAPVALIRDYYGDEIAVYFEWMNFFLRWISVPAASAILIRVLNTLFFDASASPLNAIFAIGMSYWAALFSINWNKHERGLRIEWGNLYHTEMNVEQIREEFVGEPTINPITEVMEPDYPDHKRRLMYLQSAILCAPCFAVVFVFLVACYNVTGVITAEKHGNVFVIPELAALAEEGALLDANSNMGFVTSIVQVVLTLLLNLQFRQIARWCTERENHKYQSSFDNSLIIKRFIFEFFDCFLPLIYFGWWELNFKVLRQNVISLYVVDELRRVACESLIPYLT